MAGIRLLRADEIEARVQIVTEKGFSLLLYKDARCDMRILDEVFGIYGWKRKHELINGNLFCTISIHDPKTGQWVDKQDVGTESYTEKEKGQASDAFKRAGFNVGIGRELYTAPFIWIVAQQGEVYESGKDSKGKPKYAVSNSVKLQVSEIGYNDNREINCLVITDNKGKERYKFGKKNSAAPNNTAITPDENVTQNTPFVDNIEPKPPSLKCTDCDENITQAISTYSTKHYGRELCMNCQKKESK